MSCGGCRTTTPATTRLRCCLGGQRSGHRDTSVEFLCVNEVMRPSLRPECIPWFVGFRAGVGWVLFSRPLSPKNAALHDGPQRRSPVQHPLSLPVGKLPLRSGSSRTPTYVPWAAARGRRVESSGVSLTLGCVQGFVEDLQIEVGRGEGRSPVPLDLTWRRHPPVTKHARAAGPVGGSAARIHSEGSQRFPSSTHHEPRHQGCCQSRSFGPGHTASLFFSTLRMSSQLGLSIQFDS